MPIVGTLQLNGCNYQFGWDLISQSVANNTSTVSFYGILNVTNNYVSWSSGSAWIHTARAGMSTRYNKGSYVVVQSNFTFTHNNDGTLTLAPGYGIDTTFTSGSGVVYITLPRIPRYATITGNPTSLTDEDDPYITFTNSGNATNLNAWLEVNPSSTHYAERTLSITSGTYTWELTTAERNQLRARLANAIDGKGTIRLGLHSTQGGTEGASYKDIPFTIINANPVFENFDVEEVGTTLDGLSLTTITGSTKNNIVNINGYSSIKATIPVEDKAIALKGATMKSYRFTLGEGESADYSDSEDIEITVNNAPNGTYQVIATDSRSLTTTVQKTASSEINYSKVTFNKTSCKVERNNNQVGEKAILTLEGEFWSGNFGVANNGLTITYKFKNTNGGSETTGTTVITPTISGNTFSFEGEIAGDNNTLWYLESSYEIEITVKDYLSTDNVVLILNSASPAVAIKGNCIALGEPYDSTAGGRIQLNKNIKVYDGSNWIDLFVND